MVKKLGFLKIGTQKKKAKGKEKNPYQALLENILKVGAAKCEVY